MKGLWSSHRGPWGRPVAWTCAQLPGLVIRHCGHPGVRRPYFIAGYPGHYRQLQQAKAAAIRLGCLP